MNVGDLVKTTNHPHAKTYPEGLGIITSDMGSLTCAPNDIVYVMWPETGEQRPVRLMFLEVISESR
jgi:hypothetical protein